MSSFFLLFFFVAFLSPICIDAADSPQWGRHGTRNLVSEEKNLPTTFNPGRRNPQDGSIDLATTQNIH
jgi:hypothetical protein